MSDIISVLLTMLQLVQASEASWEESILLDISLSMDRSARLFSLSCPMPVSSLHVVSISSM